MLGGGGVSAVSVGIEIFISQRKCMWSIFYICVGGRLIDTK